MRTWIVVLVLSCLTATASLAQDFNIDLADHFGTPPNSYGAAGLPGLWNNINGMLPTDPPLPLLKIDGSSSSVTIHTTGGMTGGWMAGPATGNDEALLEDWMAASDYASDVQISGLHVACKSSSARQFQSRPRLGAESKPTTTGRRAVVN